MTTRSETSGGSPRRSRLLMTLLGGAALAALVAFGVSPALSATEPGGTHDGFVADDFDSDELGPHWQLVSPADDVTLVLAKAGIGEATLDISVPGRSDHDAWNENNSQRLMQSVDDDENFALGAAFLGNPMGTYAFQGLLLQQDDDNWIRFDTYSDETTQRAFVATTSQGRSRSRLNVVIPAGGARHLRVERSGAEWRFERSGDGISWTTVGEISHQLDLSQAGVMVGNGGSQPSHVARVDYVTTARTWREDTALGTTRNVYLVRPPLGADPTTTAPSDGTPLIRLFDDDSISVRGERGPQPWVNVVGNVHDPDGLADVSVSLNGGEQVPLALGPDGVRLQNAGDFNAEIRRDELIEGANKVVIAATDVTGKQSEEELTILYESNGPASDGPLVVDWSTADKISDLGLVVDGEWALTDDGARVMSEGYDRLIALGDLGWRDLEIEAQVTVHGPPRRQMVNSAAVGLAFRWQGHSIDGARPDEQPRTEIHPLGAIAWYRFTDGVDGPGLEFRIDNTGDPVTAPAAVAVGVAYRFKVRVERIDYGTLYSMRWWVDGDPEPSTWELVSLDERRDAPSSGSVLLVAHHALATFGEVRVEFL